ncbi:MAG: indolepyruvate oxidoreductase subunit beta [Oscillospiraceae bacterium]|jgi:indolepyruvate ferredoxin oxidoreductase beta subunit
MDKNILISGVGGQGTVLASRLIAAAFMANGEFVRTAETIGMAQRGGCVVSHVRASSEEKNSIIPLGKAELLIAFEPAEAVRNLSRLSENGGCIVNTQTIVPVTSSLGEAEYNTEKVISTLKNRVKKLLFIDALPLAKRAGSPKAVNVVLLGAAIGSSLLDITKEQMENALLSMLPKKLHKINLEALSLGISAASKE